MKRRAGDFFVRPVPVDEAEEPLAEIYRKIGSARGGVANILTSTGLNPGALEAHFELYRAVMFGPSPLSRAERELVAIAVSRFNDCHY